MWKFHNINGYKTIGLISFLIINLLVISQVLAEYSDSEVRPLLPEGLDSISNEVKAYTTTTKYTRTNEYETGASNWSSNETNLQIISYDIQPLKISISEPTPSSAESSSVGVSSPSSSNSFKGLTSTDNSVWVHPPDVQLAVGPNHVVEFVNRIGRIFNKNTGATISTFKLKDFFSVPSGDDSDFDPKIIYDSISGRFFATYVSYDDKSLSTDIGRLYIAVSATNNPTESWAVYKLDMDNDFPDYPGIGLTDDKVVISYNRFDIDTSAFIGRQTLVLEKADLLAASSVRITLSPIDTTHGTIRPTHSLSSTSTQWMISGGFSNIHLHSITGTPANNNVVFTDAAHISINQNLDSPPTAKQKGASSTIDAGDNRVLEAVWKNNKLWLSASDGCIPSGDSTTRSCLRIIQIDTNSKSILADLNYGTLNEYNYYPAIRPDTSNNLIVVYSSSSENKYIETRAITLVENNFTDSILLKIGESSYAVSPFRWGDYLGAAVDPNNPAKIWVAGQYAKTPQSGDPSGGGWGTWIAQIGFSPKFSDPSTTSVVELGEPTILSTFWANDIKLHKAVLSTNETDSFKNYTDGTYNSPTTFSSNSGWSNFTWLNSSLKSGDIISWKIYVNDTSNNQNVTNTLSFRIVDTKSPVINNLTESSNTTYQRNKIFNFTANIFDYSGISQVIFELNKSKNITVLMSEVINSTTRIYELNLTDLSAGNYTYKWIAKDAAGNQNSTDSKSFQITKNTPGAFLELNGLQSNVTKLEGQVINITAYTNDSIPVTNIFANFTGEMKIISSGQGIQVNLTNISTFSTTHYQVDANITGNENYTDSKTVSLFFLTPDRTPPIFNIINNKTPVVYDLDFVSNFTVKWSDNIGLSNQYIEENFTGIFRNTTTNGTFLIVLPAGAFQFRFLANDTSDNWNKTDVFTIVVSRQTSKISIYLNGSELNKTYERGELANITTVINVTGKEVILESNFTGNIKVISNGKTLVSNMTNTSELLGNYNLTAYFVGDGNYTASISTKFITVQDTKAPFFTKFLVKPINPNIFELFWRTNEKTTGTLEYGLSTSYGSLIADNTFSNSHNLTISGLNQSTTYFFRINVSDVANNTNNLSNLNFTTGALIKTNLTANISKSVDFSQFNTTLDLTTNDTVQNVPINLTLIRENPIGVNLTVNPLNRYVNIEADERLTRNLSFVIIKVYYTDEEAAGIDESNLRLFLWNSTNWVSFDPPNGGVNTTENYVWANRSGFSTYAVGSKQTPSLSLAISPSSTVDQGTQTTASCSANTNEITVKLYRNNAEVSNPDVQTLPAAIYSYVCNNTETTNYTSTSASNTLTINSPPSSSSSGSTSGAAGGGGGGGGGISTPVTSTPTPKATVTPASAPESAPAPTTTPAPTPATPTPTAAPSPTGPENLISGLFAAGTTESTALIVAIVVGVILAGAWVMYRKRVFAFSNRRR